jgi:uncharacterized protein YndB with AHSA1/START domain
MAATTISAPPGLPFIDMEREFDAPRDLVFRAYTDPDLLARWLGPRRLTMRVDRWDVRDGGAWRYVHREADGTEYGFHGVFHGAQTPDGMLQTFEFEGAPGHVSLESLAMEERDGRTTIRMHSVFQSVEDRDAMLESGMETGVNEGFERLEALLAGLAAPVA